MYPAELNFSPHQKKVERYQINNLSLHLQALEKQEQLKYQISRKNKDQSRNKYIPRQTKVERLYLYQTGSTRHVKGSYKTH
jgi:hypothetical protein